MTTEWKNPNQYGVIGPYIWTTGPLPASETGGNKVVSVGTQYNMYDATTGQYILSVANGTDLTLKADEHGNLIGYYINSTVGTMTTYIPGYYGLPTVNEVVEITSPVLCCFNMSLSLGQALLAVGWAPQLNTVIDFGLGVMGEKPVPTAINGVSIASAFSLSSWCPLCGDAVVLTTGGIPHLFGASDETAGWQIIASMDDTTGQVLTCKNYTYPEYESLLPFTWTSTIQDSGVLGIVSLVNFKIDAIDVRTGNKAWSATLKTPYGDGTPNIYDNFGFVGQSINGKLVVYGLGGDIWAFDPKSGKQLWYTNTTTLIGDPGIETPYNVWPIWIFQPPAFTKDVGYLGIGHEYDPPMFHGAQILAINLTDGTLIWSELGTYIKSTSIAYDILLSLNLYDNQIYAFGKGPTATTVQAPEVGVTTKTPVTITGTVMDISPGAKQSLAALNFPNGLPCVSDESQSKWMEHVYQQQPMPANTTGVPITISVLDSNNNFRQIGTTTTTAMGTYDFTWTPDIPGHFTVIANFAGSNSYYPSSAETAFYSSSPQATPTATTQTNLATSDLVNNLMIYLVVGVVAIIIAIAIGFALVLRKHA